MITKPKFDESVFVCPGAAIVGDVTLGKNVNVWYNAVLRGDDGAIKVGDNTNIQDCAVLHEETTVGSGCTIGHGATAAPWATTCSSAWAPPFSTVQRSAITAS